MWEKWEERECRWEIGRKREPEEGEVEWKREKKKREREKRGSEGEKNKWREGWMSWYAG